MTKGIGRDLKGMKCFQNIFSASIRSSSHSLIDIFVKYNNFIWRLVAWIGAMPTRSMNVSLFFKIYILLFGTKFFLKPGLYDNFFGTVPV